MKKRREMIASGIGYIDPLDCGSVVGYRIRHGRFGINAEIDLSDCNRKIEWYFDGRESLVKVDKAIEMLTQFRAAFEKASKPKKKKKKKR